MILNTYLKTKTKIEKKFKLYGIEFLFYRDKNKFWLNICDEKIPETYRFKTKVDIPKFFYDEIDLDTITKNFDENQFIHEGIKKLLILLPPDLRLNHYDSNDIPK